MKIDKNNYAEIFLKENKKAKGMSSTKIWMSEKHLDRMQNILKVSGSKISIEEYVMNILEDHFLRKEKPQQ